MHRPVCTKREARTKKGWRWGWGETPACTDLFVLNVKPERKRGGDGVGRNTCVHSRVCTKREARTKRTAGGIEKHLRAQSCLY